MYLYIKKKKEKCIVPNTHKKCNLTYPHFLEIKFKPNVFILGFYIIKLLKEIIIKMPHLRSNRYLILGFDESVSQHFYLYLFILIYIYRH